MSGSGNDGRGTEKPVSAPGAVAPQNATRVTRRRALLIGGGTLGAIAAAGTGYAVGEAGGSESVPAGGVIAFDGPHQAGIATPAQARLVFGSFDFVGADAGVLRDVLRGWTAASRLMVVGRSVGTAAGAGVLPPEDTGEALDLPPARLTITIGLGPGLFERGGEDRLGLRSRRPAGLTPLGPLPGDQLDPARSDGDLCVQACADDPQVAFHAVRNLLRIARGAVELRWMQLGFDANTATTSGQVTPRNLMGFKDGTNNIKVDDAKRLDRFVWVGREERQPWLRGGTYLVARRIRMLIETWDHTALSEQEAVIGRRKISGAPLGAEHEHDKPDLRAHGTAGGDPTIPLDAHIRLAAPSQNRGAAILRRGYAYTDGVDPRTGLLDAGLFFVSFQRDPHTQFAAIQRKLGAHDSLTEYIQHTGSALFAVPPGVRPGEFVGERLFV